MAAGRIPEAAPYQLIPGIRHGIWYFRIRFGKNIFFLLPVPNPTILIMCPLVSETPFVQDNIFHPVKINVLQPEAVPLVFPKHHILRIHNLLRIEQGHFPSVRHPQECPDILHIPVFPEGTHGQTFHFPAILRQTLVHGKKIPVFLPFLFPSKEIIPLLAGNHPSIRV